MHPLLLFAVITHQVQRWRRAGDLKLLSRPPWQVCGAVTRKDMHLFCKMLFASAWHKVNYNLNFYRKMTQHIAV